MRLNVQFPGKIFAASVLAVALLSGCAEKTPEIVGVEPLPASGESSVHDEMEVFAQQFSAMMKAEDVATFQEHLQKLKAAAQLSMQLKPSKIADTNSAEFKDYQQGMQQFIQGLDEAQALAAKGDLAQAKAKAKQLTALRDEYHAKFK